MHVVVLSTHACVSREPNIMHGNTRCMATYCIVGVHQGHAQDRDEVLHQVCGDAVICQALAELRHCAAAVRGPQVSLTCRLLP
jgi:hypothetical protein